MSIHDSKDGIQNCIQLLHDFVVPEAKDFVSLRLQEIGTPLIIPARIVFGVLCAIQFDDQTKRMTRKVSEVRSNRHLPAKMRSVKRDTFQVIPELPLCIRSVVTKAAGIHFLEAFQ